MVQDQEKLNCIIEFNEQPDIDKIYLYAKDTYEAKYQYLINIREKAGLNHYADPKAFTDYSSNIYMMFTKILKITIQIKNVNY